MRGAITVGERFGRLTVLEESGRSKDGGLLVRARCECGTEKVFHYNNLRRGASRSCGCLRREVWKEIGKQRRRRVRKQGESQGDRSPEYAIWSSMKARCCNPRGTQYAYYGGRGIRVCDRWLHSFKNFLSDMGRRPTPQHSIDRINNDGDYEPGNCRWATRKEQARNQRSNVRLTYNGQTLCLAEWAERLGIHRATLRSRLKTGWPIEEAVSVLRGNQRLSQTAV